MIDGYFNTLIVHVCLRKDTVARVHLRQLMFVFDYTVHGTAYRNRARRTAPVEPSRLRRL